MLALDDDVPRATVAGLDNHGHAVGSVQFTGETRTQAALDDGDAVVDLESKVVDLGNWQLTDARGIDVNGEIAGNGLRAGVPHGFVLTPVE